MFIQFVIFLGIKYIIVCMPRNFWAVARSQPRLPLRTSFVVQQNVSSCEHYLRLPMQPHWGQRKKQTRQIWPVNVKYMHAPQDTENCPFNLDFCSKWFLKKMNTHSVELRHPWMVWDPVRQLRGHHGVPMHWVTLETSGQIPGPGDRPPYSVSPWDEVEVGVIYHRDMLWALHDVCAVAFSSTN